MVRVISVHHFAKQHIESIEQPTATAIAPPNRFLLALSSHCVEVRNLTDDASLLFSFPTVDLVKRMLHCSHGDYIATIEEKKPGRQSHETLYARVYTNWGGVATLQQCKMRARIAGRVTPTTSQSEVCGLEMIELPTKRKPEFIECCQVSGNIVILSSKYLMIYKFCVRTHDISKLRFIDFEELSLLFELSFLPTSIAMCENYIVCMNAICLHLFTISQIHNDDLNDVKHSKKDEYTFYNKSDAPLSYKQLLNDEEMYNCNTMTVNLPSIFKENSAIHKHCPFTCCDTEMTVNIKSSSPIENYTQSYQVNNLLQLKLKPVVIEGAHRQITEEFKCVVLKPLYVAAGSHKPKKSECNRSPLLKSEYGHYLNSVTCLLTTQQEGYLYLFSDNMNPMYHIDNCITVYPFTAPIYKVVLEDYMLHAITETGLESYTLRIGHQLTRNVHKVNNINVACPLVKDPVCLVGLRPFIGVEHLLMSDNYLVLLATSDLSPTHSASSSNSNSNSTNWTLYNLELPTPLVLYNDFVTLANVHQYSSPQTYCHLLSEAHMILKITIMLLKWKNKCENSVSFVSATKFDGNDVLEAYKDSCRLLGDHYVMCTEECNYTLALPYYKMAQIFPLEVLKRVQEIQNVSKNTSMTGLLYYLKTVLLQIKTWTEADVLFTLLGEQNFVDTVLDLFSKYDPNNISTLVLKNNVLREYATDKLIAIFKQSNLEEPNDLVALLILYLQKYRQKDAQLILESIGANELHNILISNWELLFDTTTAIKANDNGTTFSELAILLIGAKPDMLAVLLAYLVTDFRAVSLEKLLNIFLEFLPSHISEEGTNGSVVLQNVLEIYFKNYYSLPENVYKKTNYDSATLEALKILIRSYLSQLQIWQMNFKDKHQPRSGTTKPLNVNDCLKDLSVEIIESHFAHEQSHEDYLFSKIRWTYLDLMLPFCDGDNQPEMEMALKKLQALLCSQLVPKQILNEIFVFLNANLDFNGYTSLHSIILPINDGVALLLEEKPKCILQYAKDRFMKDEEWTILISLVQAKLIKLYNDDLNKSLYIFHIILLRDILLHLATTLPLQRFLAVLPPKSDNSANRNNCDEEHFQIFGDDLDNFQIDSYEPFISICKQTADANRIQRLIVATGQKLLTTLNL